MTTKKCCCFNLRTGNIIIAWLDVLSIFAIPSSRNAQSCIVLFFAGLLSLYAIYNVIPMIKCHPINNQSTV